MDSGSWRAKSYDHQASKLRLLVDIESRLKKVVCMNTLEDGPIANDIDRRPSGSSLDRRNLSACLPGSAF